MKESMPGTMRRPLVAALAISAPIIALVVVGRLVGSDAMAHATAFMAIVLGLPWVVPAFVVIAVLSAPVYVALHIAGQPLELMPWLSGVILLAGIVACHVNATLLLHRLLRKRARAPDAGLADFLFRSSARIG